MYAISTTHETTGSERVPIMDRQTLRFFTSLITWKTKRSDQSCKLFFIYHNLLGIPLTTLHVYKIGWLVTANPQCNEFTQSPYSLTERNHNAHNQKTHSCFTALVPQSFKSPKIIFSWEVFWISQITSTWLHLNLDFHLLSDLVMALEQRDHLSPLRSWMPPGSRWSSFTYFSISNWCLDFTSNFHSETKTSANQYCKDTASTSSTY